MIASFEGAKKYIERYILARGKYIIEIFLTDHFRTNFFVYFETREIFRKIRGALKI